MIFFDTETCGLHGMAVLIQWAEDDGPIELFSVWKEPIHKTLELIRKFANHKGGVCGFNLAFDWFHLCKLYTIFSQWHDHDDVPEDIIPELAELEPMGRDGDCLKPVSACDLMLHARKGPYQSTMDRGDIRVRRVPTALAWQLASELEKRIELKDIYFARKKDKAQKKWQVYDIVDDEKMINPDFKDIVLKFKASSALKALAVDALNIPPEKVLRFHDVEVERCWWPAEYGYAPFAKAVPFAKKIGKKSKKNMDREAWPAVIKHHISHWSYNELAREYARDDVVYTRGLYNHFGRPDPGDDDSELACMVAAVRWKGFKLDLDKLRALRKSAIEKKKAIPIGPREVKHYINELLEPACKLVLKGSTKKVLLETISKLDIPCPKCNANAKTEITVEECCDEVKELSNDFGDIPPIIVKSVISQPKVQCENCHSTGKILHPAAHRAQTVLDARKAGKEIELYDKLLLAGRFHASFKVIGALSSRMSGTDGLNAQGINKTKEVRSCFPLAWPGFSLDGGDFAGFEVTLAEACYNDPDLRKALLTCEYCDGQMVIESGDIYCPACVKRERTATNQKPCKVCKGNKAVSPTNEIYCPSCDKDGKAIHALFGVHVYPEHTYKTLKATKGTANDLYTRAKSAVFAMFYGGEGPTLQSRLGVDLETANKAFTEFGRQFKQVGNARKRIIDQFCSMRQPGGIGSKVEWHEPADKIESLFGFPRFFTLENRICKALFDLAEKPPRAWKEIRIRVVRRDRLQLAEGATRSALFGAAFSIQASSMRAAANHQIQSSGAQATKKLQRNIWGVQPHGVNPWRVIAMNIHDEVMCVTLPEYSNEVKRIVNESVESIRPKVPLIKMDWQIGLGSWADK
jgi:hypothetical protein